MAVAMLDLKRIFQAGTPVPDTEIESRDELQAGLESGYRDLILEQIERGGVALSCVNLEVRHVGVARDGRPVFLGMIRLARWERRSAVRLLLGLPILEAKVRRLTQGSWLREVSHFGGLWLHASGQLQDSGAMQDLRAIVMDIERADAAQPESGGAVWSLPTDLGKLG